METRKIGQLDVSVTGLGCNNFGRRISQDQTTAVVAAALDRGIILFDTADVYGDGLSEEYLGAALGSRRDEVVIATKFGHSIENQPESGGASPAWVRRAVEDSLRRLGTEYIDLYQQHTPDEDTPIEDTLEALNALVEAGKVLEIGCSNFSAKQIDESRDTSANSGIASFASAQNEYSLLHREPDADVLDATARHGMGFLPYFPLASGMLTGKYRKGEDPPPDTRLGGIPADRAARFLNEDNLAVVEDLVAFSQAQGHTLLELAFSWLLSRPTVASVIAGATKPSQVEANVGASHWDLTADEIAEVNRITAR